METKVVGFEQLSPTHQDMLREFLRKELAKFSCDMHFWSEVPDDNPTKVEMIGWFRALRGLYESTAR